MGDMQTYDENETMKISFSLMLCKAIEKCTLISLNEKIRRYNKQDQAV